MNSRFLVQSSGLIMLGFLLGVIFTGVGKYADQREPVGASVPAYAKANFAGEPVVYRPLAQTDHWDILTRTNGQEIALGQNGLIRAVIIDDLSALYVMTYRQSGALWEGRLIDMGNDGSVEIADISGGHCEHFAN